MNVTHLYCSCCGKEYEPCHLYNLSDRDKPLIVAYDLEQVQATLLPNAIAFGGLQGIHTAMRSLKKLKILC